jgi:hypothetical protein
MHAIEYRITLRFGPFDKLRGRIKGSVSLSNRTNRSKLLTALFEHEQHAIDQLISDKRYWSARGFKMFDVVLIAPDGTRTIM